MCLSPIPAVQSGNCEQLKWLGGPGGRADPSLPQQGPVGTFSQRVDTKAPRSLGIPSWPCWPAAPLMSALPHRDGPPDRWEQMVCFKPRPTARIDHEFDNASGKSSSQSCPPEESHASQEGACLISVPHPVISWKQPVGSVTTA